MHKQLAVPSGKLLAERVLTDVIEIMRYFHIVSLTKWIIDPILSNALWAVSQDWQKSFPCQEPLHHNSYLQCSRQHYDTCMIFLFPLI